MNSLTTARVAQVLDQLHREAEIADQSVLSLITKSIRASGKTLEQVFAELIKKEEEDLRGTMRGYAHNFLSISPEYGRFIYMCARARNAGTIVEFGTSMGISTIYLAAALRDMGGGRLIGTELEPGKVKRARANLDAAGLSDLVEIREGDALDTLKGIDREVDLVLLDGAISLYLPVLKVIEPRLKAGAVILGEDTIERPGGYLDYVRDPANGYLSQPLPINGEQGNEFTIFTR